MTGACSATGEQQRCSATGAAAGLASSSRAWNRNVRGAEEGDGQSEPVLFPVDLIQCVGCWMDGGSEPRGTACLDRAEARDLSPSPPPSPLFSSFSLSRSAPMRRRRRPPHPASAASTLNQTHLTSFSPPVLPQIHSGRHIRPSFSIGSWPPWKTSTGPGTCCSPGRDPRRGHAARRRKRSMTAMEGILGFSLRAQSINAHRHRGDAHARSITVGDVLKENAKLGQLIAQKNKIIEPRGIEISKLRLPAESEPRASQLSDHRGSSVPPSPFFSLSGKRPRSL